ncbi:MAG: sulfatase family protein [Leadbetterella sp.]
MRGIALFFFLFSGVVLWAQRPNVVIIYGDDVGYGDLSCYQNSNRIRTPNCDRLAKEGLKFTDGHSTAASCTPSRYSLMTGEYAWRRGGTNILPGDAPAIIQEGRQTLASIFQKSGYKTAHVGKWHLGLGTEKGPNWNGLIENSPNALGFDYSFGMAATGDRVPTVFVENSKVVNLDPRDPIQVDYTKKIGIEPTGSENPELLKMKHHHGHNMTIVNGIGRIGWMTGGKAARWRDEDMADVFTEKALSFIETNKTEPFFLYFATHGIHVPRVPHERFQGKSGMGARGDALLEFDETVGKVLNKLDELGLSKNTIVVLSSDNGPVINDGYYDQSVETTGFYKPAGMLRGSKGSVFEGGTRVPFIVRYPAQIQAGKTSKALISQVDLLGSFAAMLGQKTDSKTAPDTQNLLQTLFGKNPTGRKMLVEHSHAFAVTDGRWKYIHPTDIPLKYNPDTHTDLGFDQIPQLYDLQNDIAETINLAKDFPQIVEKMKAFLLKEQGDGYVYRR